MFKFLKDVVVGSAGGIKDLPYNIGDPYSSAWGSWTHHRGTSKDENSQVSIFTLTCANSHDGRLMAARNGAKRLRTVRHPNILSYLHSTEVEAMEGSVMKSTIYVVTEPVMPLSEKIKELNLEGTQRDEYYAWGLHQIAKAVSFLNNDCKLVHGNICLASVVVTPNLDWKLYAFDVLSEFDGANPQSAVPMLQFESLIALQYKPMELAKSDWVTIRKSPPWAIDSWGLGCLIYELFSGTKLSKTEELRNIGSIPKTLLTDYQRLLGSVPTRRINPSKVIENSEFFQNKLVETIHFMDVLNLKDSVEKDSFFRKLSNISEQLPREVVLKKLLPMLASSLEFGSASALAINSLLKIGSWLSTEEFNIKVLPTIVKLFASNDRGIRIGLLQHIEQFGAALSSQAVDEQVFPHVATGFSDTSAFLRELTLKSMLTLAPKLSQRTITGSLLKILSKLQVDEEVAIRTNTTILLGNIASFLGEGTRKRVLINAFTVRALRDAFPPARAAGIMALCATCMYYDPIEISTRILPSIVPLTIDGDSDVRSKAFQATEQFLNIVKGHHLKINAEDGVVNNSFVAADSAGGLLGWAMGSLALKGKGSENNAVPSGSIATSSSLPIIQKSGTVVDPSPQSTTASIELNNSAAAPISSSAVDGGWGELETNGGFEEDKDGWDDMDQVESSAASSLFAGIQSAQQKPLQPHKIHTANTRATVTASETYETNESTTTWGEEEDPWAAIAAPAPVVKSRPSNMGLSGRSGVPQVRSGQHVSLDSVLGGSKTRSSSSSSSSSGRGRGSRAAPMKLGAQRVNHPST